MPHLLSLTVLPSSVGAKRFSSMATYSRPQGVMMAA